MINRGIYFESCYFLNTNTQFSKYQYSSYHGFPQNLNSWVTCCMSVIAVKNTVFLKMWILVKGGKIRNYHSVVKSVRLGLFHAIRIKGQIVKMYTKLLGIFYLQELCNFQSFCWNHILMKLKNALLIYWIDKQFLLRVQPLLNYILCKAQLYTERAIVARFSVVEVPRTIFPMMQLLTSNFICKSSKWKLCFIM